MMATHETQRLIPRDVTHLSRFADSGTRAWCMCSRGIWRDRFARSIFSPEDSSIVFILTINHELNWMIPTPRPNVIFLLAPRWPQPQPQRAGTVYLTHVRSLPLIFERYTYLMQLRFLMTTREYATHDWEHITLYSEIPTVVRQLCTTERESVRQRLVRMWRLEVAKWYLHCRTGRWQESGFGFNGCSQEDESWNRTLRGKAGGIHGLRRANEAVLFGSQDLPR
ncbi:hypothetical protein C8J57DRAFT_1470091 [Mycena rebaudengoi]|nr:hypothetical protein C8J57DRAFT_1470091 [Mycena rebaudengoi]